MWSSRVRIVMISVEADDKGCLAVQLKERLMIQLRAREEDRDHMFLIYGLGPGVA